MAIHPSDWQLSCSSILERGQHLLLSGQFSDCTFLVGTEPNRVSFKCHKIILAMASPVFEAMFFGEIAESNAVITILDIQPDTFRTLLEYIYTDTITLTTFDKAFELFYAAKKYMLPHLIKEITNFLLSDLLPENACKAYEFAKLFDESVIMDSSIQVISTKTKEVIQDNSFLDVELDTVTAIFSLDNLHITSELDLFNAAVRYGKTLEKRDEENPADHSQKSPQSSTSSVVKLHQEVPEHPPLSESSEPAKPKIDNKEMPVTKVRDVLKQIRFLTMTPQEFAEGPAKSPLFSESESFAILMNIVSTNPSVPMPEGFSINRTPRKQLTLRVPYKVQYSDDVYKTQEYLYEPYYEPQPNCPCHFYNIPLPIKVYNRYQALTLETIIPLRLERTDCKCTPSNNAITNNWYHLQTSSSN